MIFFRNAGYPWLRVLPFLVFLLGIAMPALEQESQTDKQETVHGTVINSVTGSAIPRALVSTSDNRSAVLTDGEGHFELTLPQQNNDGGMIFRAPNSALRNYVRHRRSFFLTARKPGFLDYLRGDPSVQSASSDDITITLTPEAIIKGRITLASGDAALGITIQLFSRQVQDGLPRWTQGPTVRANSAGEFRFAELQPGSYKVLTHEFMDYDPVTNIPGSQQYGYPPMYYPGVSDFAASSTIELSAGQEAEADLSPTRQAYYPVRIPLAASDVPGYPNISVEGQRGPGYSLGYNPNEHRIEGLLPNGNYVVEALTFGQNASSGSVNLQVNGAPVEGPAMTLAPTASITLNMREQFTADSQSSAAPSDGRGAFSSHGPRSYLNASVESADDFRPQQRQTTTTRQRGPEDNRLLIENLPPGRYWLRLSTGRGYIASATQGATDVLHQPFTVGSGPAAPIEITLRDDQAEVEGTITPLSQSPPQQDPAQAWIYWIPLPDSAGQYSQCGTAGDGKFRAEMAPGDYRVLAFSRVQQQLPYRDAEAMKAYESKGTVVHLAAGQKTTVEIETLLNE